MLESVPSIDAKYHNVLYLGEWIITVFFTIEYMARIIAVKRAKMSFFTYSLPEIQAQKYCFNQ